MKARAAKSALLVFAIMLICSCGGGGGGSSSNSGGSLGGSASPLVIATNQILPATITGRPYSATLTATGASGQLHWSIAPISSTALFVTGLAIDANTGVLSGTVNWGGTAGFVATVTDSASHTNTRSFDITAYQPLTGIDFTHTFAQYGSATAFLPSPGGVPPYTYSLVSGSLPPGVQLGSNLSFTGGPTAAGAFHSTFTVQDSFSPPETATFTFDITVTPPQITAAIWLPNNVDLVANHPVSGRVVASYGVPPYTFAAGSFPVPAWLAIDGSTGQLSGTPPAPAGFELDVLVTDSSSPPQQTHASAQVIVRAVRGRNDSVVTATPLGNGSFVATISPYLDPPPTSEPGDNDYYKIVAVAGARLHLETFAKRVRSTPLDTVLEVLDGNGHQLNWCNQPGATSTSFSSPCLNDDISASPLIQDSALDLMVPGPAGSAATVYAHVLDWRGDARPDMIYSLSVNGAVDLLNATVPAGTIFLALGRTPVFGVSAFGGIPPYAWSAPTAQLPPGVTLTVSGTLSGTPTTVGTYPVTFTVTDSEIPPQTASGSVTLGVADPPHIATTALPNGQTGVPYNEPVSVTGGTPPYTLGPGFAFGGLNLGMQNGLPVVTGTPSFLGTGTVSIEVFDQLGLGDSAKLSLTITAGPLNANGTTATWKVGTNSVTFISASGGTPPYSCAVQSGNLPPGVTLTAGNCSIGGTPTASGVYNATILVTDSGSPAQTAQASASITVNP